MTGGCFAGGVIGRRITFAGHTENNDESQTRRNNQPFHFRPPAIGFGDDHQRRVVYCQEKGEGFTLRMVWATPANEAETIPN
jgi:hypothetical protein